MSELVRTQPAMEELQALSQRLEGQTPQEVLAYALDQYFPSIVLACSFGPEDVVLWDMMYQVNPKASLFYLDTDFLFKETHDVRQRMIAKYLLAPDQLIEVKPDLSPEQQAEKFGDDLWLRQPDQCCNMRKVEPLTRILKNYSAWVTGIRRDQAPTRTNTKLVEWDGKFELVKFNPLAAWTNDDVWAYIKAHDVPYNVLHDQNYPSIGCTHCTVQVKPGEDPRSGRWQNSEKTECGLHK
ncbi:MAG: phosphoadenylyl-sulfate reductase [Nitrospirae bacterium]|nr:phosphoadenylyl-sulfate reductase [Nitrospirota bacterium]MDA1305052.1 phosphoadenylyl-sulfate reductase [Nitrospirota bacterium]